MLELRIPPPLVGLIIGTGMWFVSGGIPASLQSGFIAGAVALAGSGFAIALAGVVAFRRARTTVNPLKPQEASALVTGGVYRITRNPMYLGMLLVLLAWTSLLAAPWTLLGPVAFALYITRFQIAPEERVLQSMFGDTFTAYKARVRRWM